MEPTSRNKFKFEIIHQSTKSRARVGKIHTPHGIIETPGFICVGTNGTIKGLDFFDFSQTGLQIFFANTYHLMLHPGENTISDAGGIHDFSGYNCPVITDSGGFQVFSLKYGGVSQEIKSSGKKSDCSSVLKVDEEGVVFRSYRDGAKIKLTPETSIQAQKKIGADMIVAFDELLPYHIDKKYQLESLHRTHRWAQRSLDEHKKNIANQALYAVVHGGIDRQMRDLSAKYLAGLDFDGYAVGGSVGKNLEEMSEMLDFLMPRLPEGKPNHLLGIADLPSIEKIIPLGVDTFDSSYPTKAARHGQFLTFSGGLKIGRTANKNLFKPVDENCVCYTCQNHTIAFLHHLFKSHELAFYRLASIHNLFFMSELTKAYREKILKNQI